MQYLHFFEPKRPGKSLPLAIFLHSATGHARMFYQDAMALLENGFACVSLEAPYARSRNAIQPRGLVSPVNERCLWDRTVEELGLAWEECMSRWNCDPSRVAFLGQNLGGSVGAYWIAKGAPVKAAAISGTVPDLTDFWKFSPHPVAVAARDEPGADLSAYEERMRETDLVETLSRSGNSAVLVQIGKQDPWISPESRAKVESLAAIQPNISIGLVEDGHEMNSPAAVRQRVDFITKALC